MGFGAGLVITYAIVTMDMLRIDDPVGAISVHGVAGVSGLLAVTSPLTRLASSPN
jgi:Amt family ammonium transporter